jgi:hypothetical protein
MGADNKLRIDSSHCRAICDEIGDRLRIMLDREAGALPPGLQVLLLRLAAQDLASSLSIATSIAPSIDGMEAAENRTGPVRAA